MRASQRGGEDVFSTRKQLKDRILYLEAQLENERSINRLSEDSGLSKCIGVICKSCDNAVTIQGMGWPEPRVIGCTISTLCKDFKRKELSG